MPPDAGSAGSRDRPESHPCRVMPRRPPPSTLAGGVGSRGRWVVSSEMVAAEQETAGMATVAQRWLARLALAAAAAGARGAAGPVVVPPVVAGLRQSIALVLVGLAGLALTLAGAWWALTNKGPMRGLAAALAVAAPLTVLVLYTRARLTWVVLLAFGLLALALAAGRAALRRDAIPERMAGDGVPAPRRPFLIMNPRSGGGKVVRFGLKDKAEALGATVAVLEGPGTVDVGALARQAVADGGGRGVAPAAGPRHRGRECPSSAGHLVRHPQPLRPRPRVGSGGPLPLPGR